MIYKDIDSKDREISQLKRLFNESNNPKQKALIQSDLLKIRSGYKAEKDNAYYLNFSFKDSVQNFLLHDIRIVHNDKVAQIDHLIVNRFGIEILESKSFSGILKINDDGSLDVQYDKNIKTFPNPIEQNNRHAKVLLDFIKDKIKLPSNLKLLGIPISSTILINPKTTISNRELPEGFIRADSFNTYWNKRIEKAGTFSLFKKVGTMMSLDKVKEIVELMAKSHTPISFDYSKKYRIATTTKKKEKRISSPKPKFCSKCKSQELQIRYGKYGYYFKCLSCNGNTSIKLFCKDDKCKTRLKKDKLNFYQICTVCGKNELFYTNKEFAEY